MKKTIICLVLNLFMLGIFSQSMNSDSKIVYDYNSPYYDSLYLACMEDGISLLSYRKPISVSEMALSYNLINNNHLTKQGIDSYNQLEELLYKDTSLFSEKNFKFDCNAVFALEGMYLFNSDKEPHIDKLYRYNNSLAPISIPLEFYLSNYIYAYMVPTLGKNFSGFNLSYPYTNLPLTQKALDYHFPKTAGISVGNHFFNIHIARGRLTVGRTLSGSMLISDSFDRTDFFSASVFFKYLKLDLTVAELSPTNFFISHEISIRPIKQISFTIHEGIMLDSVFDPKFLNPFMIFHNFAAWKQPYVGHEPEAEDAIGCQLGLDINIVPIQNLRIYGQFGMNQFQTLSEIKGGATNIPNSMGGILGIEYIFPLLYGHLILTTEFMYADPWLYIGFKGSKVSFFSSRTENNFASPSEEASRISYWLANPYGPDTIAAFLKLQFLKPKKYSIEFSYRFLAKGENEEKFLLETKKGGKYYPTNAPKIEGIKMAQYKTPSGKPIFFNTLNLSGKYNILKNLAVYTNLSWTITTGSIKGHSLDFNTGIRYSIRQK